MKKTYCKPTRWACAGGYFVWLCLGVAVGAEPESPLKEQVRQLQQQNEGLQRQMQQQQQVIENLSRKVSGLESAGEKRSSDPAIAGANDQSSIPAKSISPMGLGKINLSGE